MVDQASLDDETLYRVKLKKAVILQPGPTTLSPVTDNVIKGKVLKEFPADAIVEITEA